jgi:hypothetical protein
MRDAAGCCASPESMIYKYYVFKIYLMLPAALSSAYGIW